jgi:hypothetical protein
MLKLRKVSFYLPISKVDRRVCTYSKRSLQNLIHGTSQILQHIGLPLLSGWNLCTYQLL